MLVLVWNSEIAKASGAVVSLQNVMVLLNMFHLKKLLFVQMKNDFKTIEDWIAQGIDTYYLRKFERSSYSTWIHHTPIVKRGDVVKAGDIFTNGSSIE